MRQVCSLPHGIPETGGHADGLDPWESRGQRPAVAVRTFPCVESDFHLWSWTSRAGPDRVSAHALSRLSRSACDPQSMPGEGLLSRPRGRVNIDNAGSGVETSSEG